LSNFDWTVEMYMRRFSGISEMGNVLSSNAIANYECQCIERMGLRQYQRQLTMNATIVGEIA